MQLAHISKRMLICFVLMICYWIAICVAEKDLLQKYFARANYNRVMFEYPLTESGIDVSFVGVKRTDKGFILPPHQSGSIKFEFSKYEDDLIDLWPNFPFTAPNQLKFTLKTEKLTDPIVLLDHGPFIWGNILKDLDKKVYNLIQSSTHIVLTLDAVNKTETELNLLNRIRSYVHKQFAEDYFLIARIFYYSSFLLICLILFSVLSFKSNELVFLTGGFLIAGIHSFLSLKLIHSSQVFPESQGPVLFGILILLLLHQLKKISFKTFLLSTGYLWTAILAGYYWNNSTAVGYGYLHESFDMWTSYGHQMELFSKDHGFFSANFGEREPFYVFVLYIWRHIFGLSNFSHLNISLLIACSFSFISYVLAGSLLRNAFLLTLLAPALLYSKGIDQAVPDFERDPLFYILIAVFTYLVISNKPGWRKVILLTGLAVIINYTRNLVTASLILLAVLLYVFSLLAKKKKIFFLPRQQYTGAQIVFFSVILSISQLPITLNMAKRWGSASYHVDQYARWNANNEFPERLGTPGFPTKEEYYKNPYSGPHLSYFDYLFKLRSFKNLVSMNLKGLKIVLGSQLNHVRLISDPSFRKTAFLLSAFLLLGGILEVFVFNSLQLTVLVIWYLSQNFYSYHLCPAGLVGDRHVDHSVFTLMLILGLSAKRIWTYFYSVVVAVTKT